MDVIYRTPAHVLAGASVLLALLVYWGVREWRRRGFSGTVAVIWLLALTMAGLRFPSYVLDEIRVNEQRLEWHVGPWWARTEGVIEFAQVRSVRVERYTAPSGRLRFPQTAWVIEGTDGGATRFLLFDLWMDHQREIDEHFRAHGIVIREAG